MTNEKNNNKTLMGPYLQFMTFLLYNNYNNYQGSKVFKPVFT